MGNDLVAKINMAGFDGFTAFYIAFNFLNLDFIIFVGIIGGVKKNQAATTPALNY